MTDLSPLLLKPCNEIVRHDSPSLCTFWRVCGSVSKTRPPVCFLSLCVHLSVFFCACVFMWQVYKTSAMHPYFSLQGWSISVSKQMLWDVQVGSFACLHRNISIKVPASSNAHTCRVRGNRDGGLFWQLLEVRKFSVVMTVLKLRNLFWSTSVHTHTVASSRCVSTHDCVCYSIPS